MSSVTEHGSLTTGAPESVAVPRGYKRTEAGIIPEDWESKPLGAIGSFSKGQGVRKNEASSGELPCIRYGEIYTHHNDIARTYFSRISREIAATSRRLEKGDILFAGSGETKEEIGKAVAFVGEEETYAGGDIVILSPHTGSSEFLGYLLNAPLVAKQKASRGQGDAVVHISATALSSVVIPLPSLPEQRAIAEALSDVDGLLGALGALIAKKRAVKQAAMQQLLTGKTRLPGFSGPWETKRLGEIGIFSKGRGIKRTDVVDEGLPCIRYGELYTRYENYVREPLSRISAEVAETALPIRWGDLLFAGSGETAEEIGTSVAYLGDGVAYAGGDTVVLTALGQDPIYMGHLLNHSSIATQKARFGQGDAVVHISATNLAQIEVPLPPRNEQTAIATVFSDMDGEIAALERRREKIRALKLGMMQQLLTGRVRLVEPKVRGSAC